MVSGMLYPCMLCVALSMDRFVLCVACLTVSKTYCELFHKTIHNKFGCICCFVVKCDGVVECGWGALLDIPCMVFHIMCVLCLWCQ